MTNWLHEGISVTPIESTRRAVASGTAIDIRVHDPRTTVTYATVNVDNLVQLPVVGQYITEGMGRYRVLALLGGSMLEVESHIGSRLTVDWLDSGYRDPHNAWRLAA